MHYINGQWLEGEGDKLVSCNPATMEEIWHGTEATEKEIDQAVKSAERSFFDWWQLGVKKRIAYVNRLHQLLKEKSAAFAEVISKETGKPLWEAQSEVAAMNGKIPLSIEAHYDRCEDKELNEGSKRLVVEHRPHGPVAVIGPFNFPGHLPHGHIIPALLAGNTLIYKCSSHTPSVGEMYAKLLDACDLPQGVFNLVQGTGSVGAYLAAHKGVKGICFTGSFDVGSGLSHVGKMVALEMGGNNPLVVDEIDDIEGAVHAIIFSAFITSGQRCTCARRLIVIDNESLIEALITKISKIVVAPYTQIPEPFMGPVISMDSQKSLLKTQERWLKNGGKALVTMSAPIGDKPFLTPGLIDMTEVKERSDEEVFGPLLQLIRVKNLDEAIHEANDTEYGLAAGLLSKNEVSWKIFSTQVRAGVINWNTPTTGASSRAPFGGVGKSGNFHPSAYYAADYTSYPVASMQSAQIEVACPKGVGT